MYQHMSPLFNSKIYHHEGFYTRFALHQICLIFLFILKETHNIFQASLKIQIKSQAYTTHYTTFWVWWLTWMRWHDQFMSKSMHVCFLSLSLNWSRCKAKATSVDLAKTFPNPSMKINLHPFICFTERYNTTT